MENYSRISVFVEIGPDFIVIERTRTQFSRIFNTHTHTRKKMRLNLGIFSIVHWKKKEKTIINKNLCKKASKMVSPTNAFESSRCHCICSAISEAQFAFSKCLNVHWQHHSHLLGSIKHSLACLSNFVETFAIFEALFYFEPIFSFTE